jgi:hypothetical protein
MRVDAHRTIYLTECMHVYVCRVSVYMDVRASKSTSLYIRTQKVRLWHSNNRVVMSPCNLRIHSHILTLLLA